jgi:chromosome partitioning protein
LSDVSNVKFFRDFRKQSHYTFFRENREEGVMARVLVAANNKGGVGKTTTVVNLASGLAFVQEQRVLLVDLDPQGNASMALGVDIEDLEYSVKDMLIAKMIDPQYIWWPKGEFLKILPANNALKDIELELLTNVDGRLRFAERLAPLLPMFDFVIIDTAPTLSALTQSALIAASEVITPIDPGFFSLQGLRQLHEEINTIKEKFNPGLRIKGILLTKFDSRTTLSQEVEAVLRRSFPDETLQTKIRINVDLVRAQIERKSIFASAPDSTGAKDYEDFMRELMSEEFGTRAESAQKVITLLQRRSANERSKRKSGT